MDLNSEHNTRTDDRSIAISNAIDWLLNYHKEATYDALDATFFGSLADDDHHFLQELGDEVIENIMGNAFEWLLADGKITIKDQEYQVAELLLGGNAPLFSTEQRQEIEQLSVTPLRLYEIVGLEPGESMVLRDALIPEHPLVHIQNEPRSQYLVKHDFLASRVLPAEVHSELSSVIYSFPRARSLEFIRELRDGLKGFEPDSSNAKSIASVVIPFSWLQLLLNPFELPPRAEQMMGASLLFVTDLYRVQNWLALEQALLAEPGVEGCRETGWTRLSDDNKYLPSSPINVYTSIRPDRIKVFYQSKADATEGRSWFEKLAGANIIFLSRELSDLGDVLAHHDVYKAGPDATK